MSLYLVPADRKNLERSIENAVPPDMLAPHVPASTLTGLLAGAGEAGIRCWAMTTTLRSRFDAMRRGDFVLLSEKGTGRFTYFARVTDKLESRALGDALWPFKREKPWELIYFLRDILPIDVPKAELVTKLGYDSNFAVPGTTLVQDSLFEAFERNQGPLLKWLGLPSGQRELTSVSDALPGVAESATGDYSASDKIVEAKRRQQHETFSRAVKANYRNACAMCGLDEKEFLVAGHIIPWATDEQQRLNPANGMCLCVLHDRAFERGFIVLDDDFRIRLTHRVNRRSLLGRHLQPVDGQRITLPTKARPSLDLLRQHRERCLQSAPR